jgi:hypothetical protein
MNSKEAKRLEIANVIAGLTLLLVAIVCLHLAERHGAQAWTAEMVLAIWLLWRVDK